MRVPDVTWWLFAVVFIARKGKFQEIVHGQAFMRGCAYSTQSEKI